MKYRLISIASNTYWKQPADALTHTLNFSPYVEETEGNAGSGMAGAMGNGYCVQKTAAEAATFKLGDAYEVTLEPAQ